MAIKKQYKEGSDLREAITEVATVVGNTIGNTLGPAGRNYFIPTGITNDGASIIKEIEFHTDEQPDAVKNAIKEAFVEVADRQDDDAGDGTSTATTVATKLTMDIMAEVPDINTPVPGNKTVMDLSRQLDEECKEAVKLLEEQVEPVTDLETLEMIASTAMEGHEAHKIVAETIFEAGKDANTAIEDGFNGKIEKDVVPGIQFPMQIETPIMYTNHARKEAIWDDAVVLVANHVFESYQSDMSSFMRSFVQANTVGGGNGQPSMIQKKPLIIVGKHFSIPFVEQVVKVSQQSKLPILLLSAALLPEEFEDICSFVDAKYIDTHPKEGRKMSSVTFADAGHVKKIVAGKEQTAFIGGRGLELLPGTEMSQVESRAKELRKLAETEGSPKVREHLERRANGLLSGVATLYIDAKTSVDRYYLKLKVEDAMNSCKAALESGMVRGGGLALKEVAEKMPDALISQALQEPYHRIQGNAGGNLDIPDTVKNSFAADKGAIENAVAVVKILLTTEGVMADVEPDLIDSLNSKLLK